MKVELNLSNPNYHRQKFVLPEKYFKHSDVHVHKYNEYSYPQIYFTSKINPKNIDTFIDEKKLLKELNDILKENIPFIENFEEIRLKAQRYLMNLENKMVKYIEQCESIRNLSISNKISRQNAYENAKKLLKEAKLMSKFEIPQENTFVKDEKTDYELIGKFKTALENDNFSFLDVFKEHYKGLENISSIKELKELYPIIYVPERPEYVIADKLEDTLTRDFYESIYQTIKDKDLESFKALMTTKITELLDTHLKTKNSDEANFYIEKLTKPIVRSVRIKLKKIIDANSLSFIPEQRKLKKNLITDDDKKLLKIDYDDFVTSVIREQYLSMKNPNEIVYTSNGTKIKVSSIKDREYKFEKIPQRIKNLISDAEDIKIRQRSYDSYLLEHFHKRLEFYGDRLTDSEELLEHIINFSSSKFHSEDILMLKKFLSGLDSVWDGKMSMDEFLRFVRENKIKPIGTEKLNILEHQKAMEALRAEQKKLAELKVEQQKFDDFINTLYSNKMNYVAELCSSFRPETLEPEAMNRAKILINTLSDTKNLDVERIRIALFRKITYLEHENSDNPVFEAAKKYALCKDGLTDIEKIGQYIINYNMVEQYPKSMQYAKNSEIADTIIKYFGRDKESAVRYLCRYDDYVDLSQKEKSKIANILNIFDTKESIDKTVLKKIVENEYLNSDTTAKAVITKGKSVIATISSNAKKQIYDYYKFPKCIEYFRAFEDALSQFAVSKNSSGIKRLDKNNNAMKDFIELKIMGYPDRLFSYDGTYYFTDFLNTGLH